MSEGKKVRQRLKERQDEKKWTQERRREKWTGKKEKDTNAK